MDQPQRPSLSQRLKTLFFGGKHDFEDTSIFHWLTLFAFFDWIGLGADGL